MWGIVFFVKEVLHRKALTVLIYPLSYLSAEYFSVAASDYMKNRFYTLFKCLYFCLWTCKRQLKHYYWKKICCNQKVRMEKSLLLKLYEARRVSWLKWNEKEIFLYCHKEMFLGKNENLWRWSAFVNIPDRNQRHVMIQMLRHALCRWN